MFYDADGRTIQMQTINRTGGRDVITYQYDFSGKVLRVFNQYSTLGPNGRNFFACSKYEYDRNGLLTKVWKKMNTETDRLIATNEYNEIGELKTKVFGYGVEELNYKYNLRGWLTSVNKDFLQLTDHSYSEHWFGMELAYDKTTSVVSNTSYSNPQYTGNLSGALWKTRGSGVKRKFEYTYDNMDRMIAADFKQQFGTTWSNSDPNNPNFTIDFGVGGKGNTNKYIEYDDNGNIKNCWRKGLYFGVDDAIVTVAGFAFGYLISGLETDDWGWRSVKSGLITAAMFEVGYLTGGSGALAETQAILSATTTASYATMGTYIATTVATAAVAQFMPSIPIGDNFSISPAIVFGSQGISAGATVNYHSGNFSAGFGIGNGADGPKISYGGGWDDGKTGFSYYRTNYSRSYKQASAQLGVRFGSVSIRFDDDIMGDGHDRYRTGALRVGYRFSNGDEIAAGFRVRTGEVTHNDTEIDPRARHGQYQYKNEFNIQREGLLYGGYTRRGFGINAGVNSEKVRYGIQNGIHDALIKFHITTDQHFKYIPEAPSGIYGEMGRFYPFSLY